ncbi:MAG: hypothetical protein M3068_12430 [Gemmatimonadota bacterium]|nr:hypothetical protein [Gemmatimonadota bacterium]
MSHLPRSSRAVPLRALAAVAAIAVFVSCNSDRPLAPPTGDRLSVCHLSGSSRSLVQMYASELPVHWQPGDYVAGLVVDRQSTQVGDGIHYSRIGDAVAAARALRVARNETETAPCRITITVAPGVFAGSTTESADPTLESFPIVLDFPDLTLLGAMRMQVDEQGRAIGTSDGGQVTTLSPTPALLKQPGLASEPIIVVNAHPNGSKGYGITIEGFAFRSGHMGVDELVAGQGILALRARDLVVRGNRFEGGFTESIDLRSSSGLVERNHLKGRGGSCDVCLSGPGDYRARDNLLIEGGIPGFLIVPGTLLPVPSGIEQDVLPTMSLVTATVINNEVRDHLSKPVGAGLRLGAIGIGAPSVSGSTRVVASGNTLVNNTFNLIVEAAFPEANTTLRGDIDLQLSDNTLAQACQNDVLVSFSRHTTGLGLTNAGRANSPYLRSSTYRLALDYPMRWEDAWFSHPAGFDNTLIVDGKVIPNGSRTAYDASRTCAPLP